jgi:hypothetical protein
MKIEIEAFHKGYVVTYTEKEGESKYVYKCTEEKTMMQDISKRFLKLDVYVKEK